ncbi:glycosyltransferase family A protein [Paraburkholderia caribensis]|uniref:glycosyltransferase family A protein n=1 Tax=Paraburkholderia caribensis TaxID=75105 RepID=UPI001D06050E|nr:glycosyltransferase family A protein [Paraburkholderia caribensis]
MTITVLIPAFKPQYLGDLIRALNYQTLRPSRVIISDDNPERAFQAAFQNEEIRSATAGLNIEVIDGPRAGASANIRHLLRTWNGSTELAHILMDDDVVYPTFYERHAAVHSLGVFDCSISRRWTALESGQPVGELPRPEAIVNNAQRVLSLEADYVFPMTVGTCTNWLGELSNVVFNRSVTDLLTEFAIAGISFEGLGDIGFCLSASLRNPLCYLNEPLGFFRLNPGQHTQQTTSYEMKIAHLAWIALALAGQRVGKLTAEQVQHGINRIGPMTAHRFADVEDMRPFIELMPALTRADEGASAAFLTLWDPFVRANQT